MQGPTKVIFTIETIVSIMSTTITVEMKTKERLADYKLGGWTYDDVLNMLMDKVSIEDISAEHVKEHYRRLGDFKGVTKEKFKKRLEERLRSGG
jgi:vacuolar-type H+-ATPase subunit C/Vma6